MNHIEQPKLLSLRDARSRLGMKPTTFFKLLRTPGGLRKVKQGRNSFLVEAEVNAYIASLIAARDKEAEHA